MKWLGFIETPQPQATSVKTGRSGSKITHLWYKEDDYRQEYIRYARAISSWDIDFILTLEAENWQRKPDRQSMNKKEDSRWFCQLSRIWHKNIVDDPRFLSDPKRQLEQCLSKYRAGTRMYWFDIRWNYRDRFLIE